VNAHTNIPAIAPPANLEAEQAVLGYVLADDRRWYDVAERLKADDFSDPRHRLIFGGMKALVDSGKPILRGVLLAQIAGKDNGDGIAMYLAGLLAVAPKAEDATHLMGAVLHAAGRRAMLAGAARIKELAEGAALDKPVEELQQEALRLMTITEELDGGEESLGAIAAKIVSDTHEALETGEINGIRTGLRAFDDLVGTMLPGQMIVLGGETSAGKTALALQLGVMCASAGIAVYVTSLEMGRHELGARVLAARSNISAEKIGDRNVNQAELTKMAREGERLFETRMVINDRPGQSVGTIQARVSRDKAKRDTALVIVDHLQYVKPDNSRAEERVQIKQVADDVKAMAKRLGLVVILLSHVVRTSDVAQVHQASDVKRPLLRDLYGSSAIEKSADAVLFVHRPSWFLERATPGKYADQLKIDRAIWAGKAEIVLAKRRGGKGYGVNECWFDEKLTWFSDVAPPLPDDDSIPF
jgi:replicative DNA helicase